jgi:thiamine kinase-like enzyme
VLPDARRARSRRREVSEDRAIGRGEPALEPELAAAIRAVPGWTGRPARVTPLAGGITNRNFRVEVGGATYVVRLPGRDTALLGIDRTAEWEATRAAARAGVAPEPVAFLPEHGVLVTRFLEADPLPADALARDDVLTPVVTAIRTLHAMPPIASRFSPFRVVREYGRIATDRGVPAPAVCAAALARTSEIEQACRVRPSPPAPCHNDLLAANFLLRESRAFIVDYEYAGMGDPFFDLGNFAVNNGLPDDALPALLERYCGTVTRSSLARLTLMRIVSDFREAMWGVVQQAISTLDVDYRAYAHRHLDRCLASAGDARYPSWLTDAASPAGA